MQKPLTLPALILVLLSAVALAVHFQGFCAWSQIAHRASHGHRQEMMARYEALLPRFTDDPYFLYNYAYQSYRAGRFRQAHALSQRLRALASSYDHELLAGDIFMRLARPDSAVARYRQAAHMCPLRFAPLAGLLHAQLAQSDTVLARQTARTILAKPVKVPSPDIDRIRQEATALLNSQPLP